MKKETLSLILLLFPIFITAAPVTQEQAMQRALDFMNGHPRMAKGKVLKAARAPLNMQRVQTEAGYYVFNVGEQQGFVVVSGDDRTPAILGYSTAGTFDAATIPDNMKWWLEGYERQISELDRYAAAKAPAEDHETIAPLIKSTWDQIWPYNDLCPEDPVTGMKSFTCCVATAVAQVMNYYKYPAATKTTIPTYTTERYGIRIKSIPKTTIDWDNMLDSYREGATEEQCKAVATLMQLCGAALQVDYGSDISIAYFYKQVTALTKYFGYDQNLRFLDRSLYRAADWDELIYNELREHRPVLYGGQSLGGGHSFIIDGYSSDGFYHVNWGWGGYCDSFFQLSLLDPDDAGGAGASTTSDGYSFYQNVVVGIQKPQEADTPVETTRLSTDFFLINSGERVFERQSDHTFHVPLYLQMTNVSGVTRNYDVGCGVFNDNGEMVEVMQMYSARLAYYDYVWSSDEKHLFSSLPDGNYTIRALCKVSNTDEWEEGIGSFDKYIEATVSNDQLIVQDYYDFDMSGTIEPAGQQPSMGGSVPIKATLTNNGFNFNKVAFLEVNGREVGGTYIEAEAGQTVTVNLSFQPTRSGINEVRLLLPSGVNPYVLAEGRIDVLGLETPSLMFDLSVKDLRVNITLPHTKAEVTARIHNNSRNAYNNAIKLVLFKWNYDKEEWLIADDKTMDVALEGDGDGVAEAVFEGLDNDAPYYVLGYFIGSDGEFCFNQNERVHFFTQEPADGKEDMTYMIKDPDFEQGGYDWTVDAVAEGNVRAGGTNENICFEAWNNRQFDIHQVVTGLPAGIYEIQVQGFYRNRRGANAWNAYQNGVNVPVYVYLNNSATPLKNVFDEPAEAGFYSGDFYVSPTGLYFPNDMATSARAFSAGMYRQSAYGLVMGENDMVNIGVKGATNQNGDSWAIWDNFKLIYLGFDPQYIQPALQQALETANGLCAQMMGKTAYEKLTNAIAEAERAAQETDGELMFQMLNRLYVVNEEAAASAREFMRLATALEELQWAVDHYHVASDADQQKGAEMLKTLSDNAVAHQYEQEDIDGLISQIKALVRLLRMPENMELATADAPVECTSLLNTPSFEHDGENSIDGWYGSGYINFGNDELQARTLALEVFQNVLTLYQTVVGVPNGYYGMQVSAFYRFGTPDQDAEYYRRGIQPSHAVVFMGDPTGENPQVSKPVVLLSSGASAQYLSSGDEWYNTDGLYVPNDMVSSVAYFQQGKYQNHLTYNVTNNCLQLGIDKSSVIDSDWLMMDDFRLFYYGENDPYGDVVGIDPIRSSASAATTEYFDLSGRRLSAGSAGNLLNPAPGQFVISRQTQSDGTVIIRKVK